MPEIRDHDKQPLALGEERLRLIVDAAPNGMLMVNQKGEIVLVNSQIERMFQYNRAELLGQSVEMLVPEAVRERHAAYRDKFFHETPTRAMGVGRDLHGLRKDGSQILVEIGLSPLQAEGETFVLAAVVDITERKRAEELLQDQMLAVRKSATRATEAEAFLKLALAASQTGVFSHDLATDKVTNDDQLTAIFGGTLGDDFSNFLGRVHVDDRGAVERSIKAAIKEKCGYELDYRIVWPDSSIHHIFARGNVNYWRLRRHNQAQTGRAGALTTSRYRRVFR
jgi:PAS domain S-box-containing protein